jgi:hypothetical protein
MFEAVMSSMTMGSFDRSEAADCVADRAHPAGAAAGEQHEGLWDVG